MKLKLLPFIFLSKEALCSFFFRTRENGFTKRNFPPEGVLFFHLTIRPIVCSVFSDVVFCLNFDPFFLFFFLSYSLARCLLFIYFWSGFGPGSSHFKTPPFQVKKKKSESEFGSNWIWFYLSTRISKPNYFLQLAQHV